MLTRQTEITDANLKILCKRVNNLPEFASARITLWRCYLQLEREKRKNEFGSTKWEDRG